MSSNRGTTRCTDCACLVEQISVLQKFLAETHDTQSVQCSVSVCVVEIPHWLVVYYQAASTHDHKLKVMTSLSDMKKKTDCCLLIVSRSVVTI